MQGLRGGRKQKVLEEMASLPAKESWTRTLENWEGMGHRGSRNYCLSTITLSAVGKRPSLCHPQDPRLSIMSIICLFVSFPS